MIVSMGSPEAMEQFNASEIGDTNGNGYPEFLDSWGRPISFRWAPGFRHRTSAREFKLPIPPPTTIPSTPEIKIDQNAFQLLPLIYSGGPNTDPGLLVESGIPAELATTSATRKAQVSRARRGNVLSWRYTSQGCFYANRPAGQRHHQLRRHNQPQHRPITCESQPPTTRRTSPAAAGPKAGLLECGDSSPLFVWRRGMVVVAPGQKAAMNRRTPKNGPGFGSAATPMQPNGPTVPGGTRHVMPVYGHFRRRRIRPGVYAGLTLRLCVFA